MRSGLRLRRLDQMTELRPGETAGEAAGIPAFLDLVNRALAQSLCNEMVVYVHGASNAMHRGTAQAAQFRHFAGRNVVVLSFVSPSAERLRTYAMDPDHARQSQPMFARLMELLAEHTSAHKIDVLA